MLSKEVLYIHIENFCDLILAQTFATSNMHSITKLNYPRAFILSFISSEFSTYDHAKFSKYDRQRVIFIVSKLIPWFSVSPSECPILWHVFRVSGVDRVLANPASAHADLQAFFSLLPRGRVHRKVSTSPFVYFICFVHPVPVFVGGEGEGVAIQFAPVKKEVCCFSFMWTCWIVEFVCKVRELRQLTGPL